MRGFPVSSPLVWLPLASAHYFVARVFLLASAWSAIAIFAFRLGADRTLVASLICMVWVVAIYFAVRPHTYSHVFANGGSCDFLFLLGGVLAASMVGLGFMPLGLLFLLVVKVTYRVGFWLAALIEEHRIDEGHDGESCRSKLGDLASILFSWMGYIGRYEFLYGAVRSTSPSRTYSENDPATLAGSLACGWLMLSLAPILVYSAWATGERLSYEDADERTAFHRDVAYANTLHFDGIDWHIVLPSWTELASTVSELATDWEGYITDAIDAIASIDDWVEFDPTYYLKTTSSFEALGVVLLVVKAGVAYTNRAWTAIDLLLSNQDKCSWCCNGDEEGHGAMIEMYLTKVDASVISAKVIERYAKGGLFTNDSNWNDPDSTEPEEEKEKYKNASTTFKWI
eukprot:5500344-Prymnesium_polylepis.2